MIKIIPEHVLVFLKSGKSGKRSSNLFIYKKTMRWASSVVIILIRELGDNGML